MSIEQKLRQFRTTARKQSKVVIGKPLADYIYAEQGLPVIRNVTNTCVFCGAFENMTKEHVLPRWTFEGNTNKFFLTYTDGWKILRYRVRLPTIAQLNKFPSYRWEEVNFFTTT